MDKIRIMLVDDHQIMLDGIRSLLISDPDFEIVGEATRGSQALELLSTIKTDLVITDIHMPEMNGIEFTKKIHEHHPLVKVLALSMSGEEAMISEMLVAGISGYVLKNTGKGELRNAINRIMHGETYFSAEVAEKLTRVLLDQKRKENEPKTNRLTQREVEIVKLISKEYSNEKIAQELFISERTVETHRKNIFRKTGTKGVLALIRYAEEKKLI